MIESSNRSATNTSLCDQCLGMMHIHCICDSRRGGRHDASCLGVSSRVRVTIELRRLYRLCLVHLTTRVIKIHRLRSFSLPETRNHLCRKANEQNEGCWERKRGERKKVPYLALIAPGSKPRATSHSSLSDLSCCVGIKSSKHHTCLMPTNLPFRILAAANFLEEPYPLAVFQAGYFTLSGQLVSTVDGSAIPGFAQKPSETREESEKAGP